ncbi:MAG: zinc ribbon domain-containing protein [Clostridiaceae bacterium]|jgi:hypothetical protein|nr:zinc ribbon domain-containing protein [Clostridiaceae bacterium]
MNGDPYEGQLTSPGLNGPVKLTIADDALDLDTGQGRSTLPYADIRSLSMQDDDVQVTAAGQRLVISRLGQACQWFYDELIAAYNRCVLRALFIDKAPLLTTSGTIELREDQSGWTETGQIAVFDDCLCVLPPDSRARRLPLAFVTAIERQPYGLTLSLSSGETCHLERLGYDLDPLARQLNACRRALSDQAQAARQLLVPQLSRSQALQAAVLLPEGLAVTLSSLQAELPDLAQAVQDLAAARLDWSWPLIREAGDQDRLCVGLKETAPASEDGEATPDWHLWVVAPGRDQQAAAVELALAGDEAAATYVYLTGGSFEVFLPLLNRAFEAAGFRRELLALTEQELLQGRYAAYRMLIERTPSLLELRRRYAGRVVHANPTSWENGLRNLLAAQPPSLADAGPAYCSGCGGRLSPQAAFCGQCGRPVRH